MRGNWERGTAILNRVVREDPTEVEGGSCVDILDKSLPGGGAGQCKGPEAGRREGRSSASRAEPSDVQVER